MKKYYFPGDLVMVVMNHFPVIQLLTQVLQVLELERFVFKFIGYNQTTFLWSIEPTRVISLQGWT